MKKLFALVLVVCMLFAAAFAEVAVGNILDAAGNVIATVESIEDRETAAAAELLNKAFDLVKNGAEDVLAAAGLNTDVVITDIFAITVVEGNTVEIATDADVVLFSADGITWEVLTEGKIASSGAVALISNRASVIAAGAEALDAKLAVQENVITIEGEKNFTGSVYGKAAPDVVVTEQVVAVITTATGETISIPVDAAGMVVTAVANRETSGDLAVRENLKWAYANIMAAESADALVEEELGNVVVRDLFDVSLYGEFKAAVEEEGATFTATFADVAGEGLVVLCSHDFATWHTVAAENVVVNADGSVSITLDEAGAIAFAVAAEETVDGGVVSPN